MLDGHSGNRSRCCPRRPPATRTATAALHVRGDDAGSAAANHSTSQTVADDLGTVREYGLTSDEAAQRLAEVGPNALTERPGKSAWSIVREQLTAVMMLVLLVAAAISVALGDIVDALAILAIVALNAALGFQQEFRAERAMEALKRMTVPLVKVRRDGQVQGISAAALVPGDVLVLEAGDIVLADARLLSSPNLRVQEAALTGNRSRSTKTPTRRPRRRAAGGSTKYGLHGARPWSWACGKASSSPRACVPSWAASPPPAGGRPTADSASERLEGLARWLAMVAVIVVTIVFGTGFARGEDPRPCS